MQDHWHHIARNRLHSTKSLQCHCHWHCFWLLPRPLTALLSPTADATRQPSDALWQFPDAPTAAGGPAAAPRAGLHAIPQPQPVLMMTARARPRRRRREDVDDEEDEEVNEEEEEGQEEEEAFEFSPGFWCAASPSAGMLLLLLLLLMSAGRSR